MEMDRSLSGCEIERVIRNTRINMYTTVISGTGILVFQMFGLRIRPQKGDGNWRQSMGKDGTDLV